jgi:hypothetical protein
MFSRSQNVPVCLRFVSMAMMAVALQGWAWAQETKINKAQVIELVGRVAEGTTTISGVGPTSATIKVVDGDTGAPFALEDGNMATSANATTGLFAAILAAPLYSGQNIQVVALSPAGAQLAQTAKITILGVADWGRVRANFTAGVVMSFNDDFLLSSASPSGGVTSNSQSTLFLALDLEKNWKWGGVKNSVAAAGWVPQKFELAARYMFSTFLEGRLTSVPVSVCSTGSASGSATTASCTGNADNLSTFLSSAKSAEIQGGAYAPILTSVWSYQNAPNALFAAPIARVGFITPTDSVTGSGSAAVNAGQVYNFYAFGARLGHFKLSTDRNSDPELLSYIDVMWGRYSNLESLVAEPGGTVAERRWRVAIETVLKVPSTPLVLGMSANIGQNLLGAPTVQSAKDDVRFFIGAKFDMGRVLAKVPLF